MINKTKQLFQHQGFKKYFANTSWLFAEKILRMGVGLFVGIWVARYLGPEKFGILNYSLSYVYLFSAIAGLGLRSILVRELVKSDTDKINKLLGTGFFLQLFGAVVLVGLVNMSNIFINTEDIYRYMILFISIGVLFQSFQVIDFYFQSKVLSKYIVRVNLTVLVIVNIYKIYLLYIEADLIYFAVSYLVDAIVMAIGFILVYKKENLDITQWSFDKNIAKELLKDSWPLLLSGIVVNIYMKIDQVMIKSFLTASDVGYYAVATRLVEAWYFIPTILSSTFAPAIIKAHKRSLKLFNQRLIRLYSLYLWVSIIVTIFMILSAKFLILLLFGEQYLASIIILQIYTLSTIGVFVGMATSQYLIAKNLTKLSFYRTLIGMFVNVILNIILIPKYGVIGAAIATVISYNMALMITFFFKDFRVQNINILKSLNPLRIKGN